MGIGIFRQVNGQRVRVKNRTCEHCEGKTSLVCNYILPESDFDESKLTVNVINRRTTKHYC